MEVVLPSDERQPTTHDLPNAFPSFPLLVRLLGFAHRFSPDRAAIKDLTNRSSASHITLLNDTIALRNEIYQSLDERVRDLLAIEGHVSFLLLAGPGYDYVVGFLAILSLGGIVVPISPHVPLKEALYFAEKSAASAIVSRETLRGFVTALQTSAHESRGCALPAIYASQQTTTRRQLQPDEIHIETNRSLSADKPGLMIFTSGTTGKPKAVLLPREIMVSGVQALADHFDVRPSDVALHCMPVHHIAGIVVCFVPFLFGGACIEFDSFDPQRIWDRWQHGGLTVFGGVPTMYSRLMRYYEDNILGTSSQGSCTEGLRSLRFMMSGTSALPAPLRNKWSALSGGKRILERYGASEFGVALLTPLNAGSDVIEGSVGKALVGCDVKLASEPVGEILVKVPGMFLCYYRDPKATTEAFTTDGYYKTGDIGRRQGSSWFILGRESVDIIKSGGYKISALDIEREILGLSYISEVAVVGAHDEDFGERVAALVVPRRKQDITITELRNDLRSALSGYKLPTLLCVIDGLPKTASGKVQKVALRKQVFEDPNFNGVIQRFERPAVDKKARWSKL